MNSPAQSPGSLPCPIRQTPPKGIAAGFLILLITLSSAMVGVGLQAMYTPSTLLADVADVASVVLFLTALLFLWKVIPSAKGLIPVLVLGGVAAAFLTYSIVPAAVLISMILSVGAGGYLLAVTPRRFLPLLLLIPAAAYGLSVAASLNPLSGCAALIPFPALVVMALGTKNSAGRKDGLTRMGVLCLTSVTLILTLAAAFFLALWLTEENFDLRRFPEMLDAFREAYIRDMVAEYNLQLESLVIPEGTSPEVVEILTTKMTYKEAANLVNNAFNLLPGLLVSVVNVLAALAQLVTQSSLRTFGQEDTLTDRVKVFRISLLSCIVFTVAYFGVIGLVADMATGSESTLGGVIALNAFEILLPGMAFAGLLRLMELIRRKNPRGVGCLLALLIFNPLAWILAPLALPIVEVIGNAFSFLSEKFNAEDDD